MSTTTTISSSKLKTEIVSITYTFISGFALGIIPFINAMSWDHMDKAVIIGAIIAGFRAGVKVIGELVVPQLTTWSTKVMAKYKLTPVDNSTEITQ